MEGIGCGISTTAPWQGHLANFKHIGFSRSYLGDPLLHHGDILVANHWTFRSSGIILGSFLHHIS